MAQLLENAPKGGAKGKEPTCRARKCRCMMVSLRSVFRTDGFEIVQSPGFLLVWSASPISSGTIYRAARRSCRPHWHAHTSIRIRPLEHGGVRRSALADLVICLTSHVCGASLVGWHQPSTGQGLRMLGPLNRERQGRRSQRDHGR